MIAMLFLVTVALLLLTSPQYIRYIISSSVNYTTSPQAFASFYLFIHASNKLFVTNYCINFFMYVTSGTKFRLDLNKLFSSNTSTVTNEQEIQVTKSSIVQHIIYNLDVIFLDSLIL